MLWLVFPAYNEKENLVPLLPKIHNFLKDKNENCKILIIDDGSTDSTKGLQNCLSESLPVEMISHEKNKGIGGVFKTAFSALSHMADDNDFVVVMEADGTSDYTLLPELVRKLKNGNDIVIASRYATGGAYKNFPLKRRLMSVGANFIFQAVFRNKKIRDYTIFFRGYRMGLIKKALAIYKGGFIVSKTFLANAEVLINLARLTDNIAEVPFIYAYDLKIGKSKLPIFKTLFEYLKFLTIKILRPSP